MDRNLRILIADKNRYHALLIERGLRNRFAASIVAVFRSADQAIEELQKTTYDAAVIDCTCAANSDSNIVEAVRRCRRHLPILLTTPPGTVLPDVYPGDNGLTAFVVKDSTFHILIPQLVAHVLEQGSFYRDGRPLRPRLTARRKADMINITANTLAHEINNPLMAILGITELLLGDSNGCDAEVKQKVRVIQESARRIESALHHLGSLSRATLRPTAAGSLIDTNRPSGTSGPEG
ncbi:MAG TPA: histidine kinase dimerization/phospho-acceptor domain-containing protein [Acidobacteriota bacterium]|nr:histidine kinase dimerization/phospho-acceptor domain-containing protein [Acidobacteriota bacterium]